MKVTNGEIAHNDNMSDFIFGHNVFKQEAQESQYRSMAIRQKLNLKTDQQVLMAMVFLPINMTQRNLIEGHPRNISTKLFENWSNTLAGEDFFTIAI